MSCSGGGYYQNCSQLSSGCVDKLGCPDDICPDFVIKRYDTLPPLSISIEDCNGPIDLTDCVAEVSMWAKGKIKTAITSTETTISFADEIGFYQCYPGDIIVVSQIRNPERMLVSSIDEVNKTITVVRGYQGTAQYAYKKGTGIKIYRILNATASTETVTETVDNIDGTKSTIVVSSELIYNWAISDTCLPGCYYIEFRLLKMILLDEGSIPEFISTVSSTDCYLGYGVESTRRFPVEKEGYLIKIVDTQTSEYLVAN